MPSNFDWRQEGAVTPVLDMGVCGASYAFSSIGAIESGWQIKNGGACTSSLSRSSSTAKLSRPIITVDVMMVDPSKKPSSMLRIRGWFRQKITRTMGPTGPVGSDQAMLLSAPKVTLPLSAIQHKI
jgi:hypothetical protein